MNDRNPRGTAGATARSAPGGAWLRALGTLCVGLLVAGGIGGCASGVAEPPVASAAPALKPVRLTITNEATRSWQLSFLDLDGFEVRQLRLRAREEATIELAGGEYTLEQALLSTSGARETVRRFALRLKPGGSYTWTLATLLTDAAGERGGRVAVRD